MSRRDTILIAVLINAGLLVILFATAMHGGNDLAKESSSSAPQVAAIAPIQPVELAAIPSAPMQQPVIGDEVDQVLNQFEKGVMAIRFPEAADADKAVVDVPQAMTGGVSEEGGSVAPSIAQSEAPASKDDYVQVTVKRGDILERIARTNGTSVDEIMRVNHLPNTKLKIGQILKVPTSKHAVKRGATASKPTPAAAEQGEARFYTIKSGDNPWIIANKFRMPLEEFLKLNNLNEEKARKLKPGDKVRVR